MPRCKECGGNMRHVVYSLHKPDKRNGWYCEGCGRGPIQPPDSPDAEAEARDYAGRLLAAPPMPDRPTQ